ncbi:MAG: GAP family protein [Thermomicrobiales bacterium]
MTEAIVAMIPMMLAAALVPAPIILVLMLLRGSGGLAAGAAFVAGVTVVRLVQGALFGFIFEEAMAGRSASGPGPIAATLLVVVGILLWITAVKTLRKEEDPDAPPSKWSAMLRTASPALAFGMGLALQSLAAKQWVFTLGALGILSEAALTESEFIIAYLVFVLAAEALLLLPVLAMLVARDAAAPVLESIGAWMERNNRAIKIAVSVIFGTYFLWKGLSALVG